MFGFGTIFCVMCDHRVARRDALALSGRKHIGVCRGCRGKWVQAGGACARCKTPVSGDGALGLFVDRYALGHRDCGATALADMGAGARVGW